MHYRRADQRSLKKYFVKAPIILHSGIILKPRARIFLANKKVFARFISRTYKARQKRAITLFRRRSSSLFYKKAVEHIPTRSLRIRTKVISFAHRLNLRKNFNLRFQYLNKVSKKIKTFKQIYKHSKIFVSQARRIYKNKQLISKFFVNKEDNDLNDPNTERRGEV